MGSIYYIPKTKVWRVEIRYKGIPTVTMVFDTEKEAREFFEKANKIAKERVKKNKIDKKIKALLN